MPLTVTDCVVTNNSITISFSDPVFTKSQVKTPPGWLVLPQTGSTKARVTTARNTKVLEDYRLIYPLIFYKQNR